MLKGAPGNKRSVIPVEIKTTNLCGSVRWKSQKCEGQGRYVLWWGLGVDVVERL